jgi:lipid-A-disaccharide synthase-like uncharacterized protein
MLEWFQDKSAAELIWIGVGLGGQALFSMRFLLQWIMSERARRSVVPELFWYFSLGGGLTLFAYAVHREDPVFMIGQATGLIIYSRNIWLIQREKREKRAAGEGAAHEIPRAP